MTYANAEIALNDLPKHSLVEYSDLSPLYPRINAAITLVFCCGLVAGFEIVALLANFPSYVLYETGLFWREQTIQPLRRIQHIELTRGPVDKRYGLAKLRLFSSGNDSDTFVIPALPLAQAEQLREFVLTSREEI